jgi:hypothetical protein
MARQTLQFPENGGKYSLMLYCSYHIFSWWLISFFFPSHCSSWNTCRPGKDNGKKKLNLKVRLFGMSVLILAYLHVVCNLLQTMWASAIARIQKQVTDATWELVLLASIMSEMCVLWEGAYVISRWVFLKQISQIWRLIETKSHRGNFHRGNLVVFIALC